MTERRPIEGMIERKEQEIQQLEERVQEAKIYLQALRDVLKKFPKDVTVDESSAAKNLRPGSMVAQARDLILQFGKPLHVDEMLTAQGKTLTRDNRTALGGSLSAYVRKGQIFTRVGPNTFGLTELAKSNAGSEPPEDFGTDKRSIDDDMPDF
jgi:predicted RNase H-like nuclease (RuvC/YqgF family)